MCVACRVYAWWCAVGRVCTVARASLCDLCAVAQPRRACGCTVCLFALPCFCVGVRRMCACALVASPASVRLRSLHTHHSRRMPTLACTPRAANSCEDQALQGRRQVQDPLQPGTCLGRAAQGGGASLGLWSACRRAVAVVRLTASRDGRSLPPQYLYTLCVKENEKAEKLAQSLPPGTFDVRVLLPGQCNPPPAP